MKRTLLVCALVGLCSGSLRYARAEEAPAMSTDRPGNGNAATTVPLHALQIEASAAYARESVAGTAFQQVAFPTLLRFGVSRSLEARLGSSIVGIDATSGSDAGPELTDTSVGLKLQLASASGWMPDLAVMVDVALATGGGGFTSDATIPDARVAASWGLPHGFGLLVNAGADVPVAADDRFVRLGYVVNLGVAPASLLGGRLTLFAEAFGRVSLDSDQPHIIQLDVGAAYSLDRVWQVDVFTQHGLSDAAADFQLSVGLSTRL